jgi:PAS domain S-box-containing protein
MRDHWQIVPQSLGVAVARISPDGKWLAANQCLCDLLGSAFDEFSDTPFDKLFLAHDPQVEDDLRESLLTRQIPYYSSEREVNHGDGKTLSTRIVFSLEREEGTEARSILAMVEDRTALRNAQAALQESENARRELARRLTNAQERSARASRVSYTTTLGNLLPFCESRCSERASRFRAQWVKRIPRSRTFATT